MIESRQHLASETHEHSSEKKFNIPSLQSIDWLKVSRTFLTSRIIDQIEVDKLVPAKKIFNQFSATGHELAQIVLAQYLTHPHDAVCGYYRSRPLALGLGVPLEDVIAGPLACAGSFSNGRDVGVVFNFPSRESAQMLPTHGGVGAQYTPVTGWARAINYYTNQLKDISYRGAVAVSCGGDGSVATNGFWSALNTASCLSLPQLFFIEDNEFGISVSSELQTPGGNIARNLAAFTNLRVAEVDGSDPASLVNTLEQAFTQLRSECPAPWLIRIKVPRLCGHTYQDNQAYRTQESIDSAKSRDPLISLKRILSSEDPIAWGNLEVIARKQVNDAYQKAELRPQPDIQSVGQFQFAESTSFLKVPNILPESGAPVTLLGAIRKTLATELAHDERVCVFGEDVGLMGGVHAATLGLQQEFNKLRVFDTSLSEEGIVGNAVGMAYAGLKPVVEIQFRKYADSAVEQLRDCGSVRWRTANRFSAPLVVRMPVGYAKRGDLWHAESNESEWIHSVGWKLAFPSNAEDAAGLLRYAIRAQDPIMFLEHRYLMDSVWAKRNWPGNEFILPLGVGKTVRVGNRMTVISWGACVEEADLAIRAHFNPGEIELIDLRSLKPWDKSLCIDSVNKTGRCLIVHEDYLTLGFGAEIAAFLQENCFYFLDAPIQRLAKPDVPCPHNKFLMDAVLPKADAIAASIDLVLGA